MQAYAGRPELASGLRLLSPAIGPRANGATPLEAHGATPCSVSAPTDIFRAMPRKKLDPVDAETKRTIGALLRDLRRAAGYRAVHDAAAVKDCPAAQQTIYA